MDTELLEHLRADTLRLEPDRAEGPNPVDQAEIGRWCDAFEDRNPICTGAAAAREIGLDGPFAPPHVDGQVSLEGL